MIWNDNNIVTYCESDIKHHHVSDTGLRHLLQSHRSINLYRWLLEIVFRQNDRSINWRIIKKREICLWVGRIYISKLVRRIGFTITCRYFVFFSSLLGDSPCFFFAFAVTASIAMAKWTLANFFEWIIYIDKPNIYIFMWHKHNA